MIDLTDDDDGVSRTAVSVSPPSSSSPAVNWQSLEQQFLSLTYDMLPRQSHVQQNLTNVVSSSVVFSQPLAPASNSSLIYMFPINFLPSDIVSSAEHLQVSVTSVSPQSSTGHRLSAGATGSPTLSPSTAVRQLAGGTVVSGPLSVVRSPQFISSILSSGRSANLSQTPWHGIGVITTRSSVPSSVASPVSIVPISVSAAVTSNAPTASTTTNRLRFPTPAAFHDFLRPRGTSFREAATSVRQQAEAAKSYRVFRLQPRHQQPQPQPFRPTVPQVIATGTPQLPRQPVTLTVLPQAASTTASQLQNRTLTPLASQAVPTRAQLLQPVYVPIASQANLISPPPLQFSLPTICTGYRVNLASPPVTLVTTILSPNASASYLYPLPQTQANTGSSAAAAAGRTDEFVDIESINIDQLQPIVIAPDASAEEYNLPADCAVSVKEEERTSTMRKSTSRQQPNEVICVYDDDECLDVTDVGPRENALTDGAALEADVTGEVNTDEALLLAGCAEDAGGDSAQLPTAVDVADDVPVINIVPDGSSCSPPVQTETMPDLLHFPSLSSVIEDAALPGTSLSAVSESVNVTTVVASCFSSSFIVSAGISSTVLSSHMDTGSSFLARSASFTGTTFSQINNVVFVPQVTEQQNAVQSNVGHTIHYLPSQCVNISALPAPVPTSRVSVVSSASPVSYITTQPAIAVSLVPLVTPLNSALSMVSSQQVPVSSAPLSTVTTCSVASTSSVTAMAAQLVSGLRSDAMRRRATSAAKAAVHQTTPLLSRKRHDDDNDTVAVPTKSSRYIPPILKRTTRPATEMAKSTRVSPKKPENKKCGETVVYQLNDDGSVEIRIEEGSISENTTRCKQKTSTQSSGFDAVVEISSNASKLWCSETFVFDMEKYFDRLKVVTLSGNGPVTSDDKLHDSNEQEHAGEEKRKKTDDVSKSSKTRSDVTVLFSDSDSDSRDTLSLVIDSVEPSDDDNNDVDGPCIEGGNAAGLTISNVCSIDAEAFTDLGESVAATGPEPVSATGPSVVPDIQHKPALVDRTAEDVEIPRRNDTNVSVDVNISISRNDAQPQRDKQNEPGRANTSPARITDIDLSADSHVEPARSSSFSGETHKERLDLEDEEALCLSDDSENASLFEISLDEEDEVITDKDSALALPGASSDKPVDTLSDIVIFSKLANDLTTSENILAGTNLCVETDRMPESEKSASQTKFISSDSLSDVEPDSPLPSGDQQAIESKVSNMTVAGGLEVESFGSLKVVVEKSGAQTASGDSSRLDTEPVFPQAEPSRDGENIGSRSSPHLIPTVPSMDNLNPPATGSYSNLIITEPISPGYSLIMTEPVSPALEVCSPPDGNAQVEQGNQLIVPISAAAAAAAYSSMINIEPVSPASELHMIDLEPISPASEHDRSSPVLASSPVPEAERLEAPGCSNLIDLEAISPASEPHIDSDHSSPVLAASSVLEAERFKTAGNDGLIDVESVFSVPESAVEAVPEVSSEAVLPCAADGSAFSTAQSQSKSTDKEPEFSATEPTGDTNAHLGDVEPDHDDVVPDHGDVRSDHSDIKLDCGGVMPDHSDVRPSHYDVIQDHCDDVPNHGSAAAKGLSYPASEVSDFEARAGHNSPTDTEPLNLPSISAAGEANLTSQPGPLVTTGSFTAASALESERSAFVVKGNVPNVASLSPDRPPGVDPESISMSVPLAEMSDFSLRQIAAPHPTHDVVESGELEQRDDNGSLCSDQAGVVPAPVTDRPFASKSSEMNSVLSVLNRPPDLKCVSANWVSVMLAELHSHRDKHSRSGVHSSRASASTEHHSGSHRDAKHSRELRHAGSRSSVAVKQPKDQHETGSRAPLIAKVPKKITLADYRIRKSASQVPAADSCQQVEPSSSVADSHEIASEACESRFTSSAAMPFAESHFLAAVSANLDAVVSDSVARLSCTDSDGLAGRGSSDAILINSDLQQTVLLPSTVSFNADLVCSSSSPAENSSFPIARLAAPVEEEICMSENMNDSNKTAEVTDDSAHVLSLDKPVMAARTEQSDVLSAADCYSKNIDQLCRTPSNADVLATELSKDGPNTKVLVEKTEPSRSDHSDDHTEAAEADLSASPSLCGTDAEMLDDVILNFSSAKKLKKQSVQCSSDGKNSTLQGTKLFDCSESDVSAVGADLSVAPSLCGTDAEIFNSVILDFASPNETEVEKKSAECSNDDSQNIELESTKPVCCPESDTELSAADDRTEAVEAHLLVAPSLSGTDAEILDDVVVDFAISSKEEKKKRKKKHKRKPWKFSLIPVDAMDVSSSPEPTTPNGSADIRTLPKHLRYRDHELQFKDLPVTVPLEPLDAHSQHSGDTDVITQDATHGHTRDNASDLFSGSGLSVVSLKTAERPSSGTAVEQSSLHSDSKIILLTDSTKVSSVLTSDEGLCTSSDSDLETNDGQPHADHIHMTGASATSDSDQKLITKLDENLMKVNCASSADKRKHDDQRLHTAANSEKPHVSHSESTSQDEPTTQNLPNSSETASNVMPTSTSSNDYVIVRDRVVQLMDRVTKLKPGERDRLEDAVSTSLKTTEILLQEELVCVDVAAELSSVEAGLLVNKQSRMTGLLSSVESQLPEMSHRLYEMTDAEAELSSYEKADWLTESSLQHNMLLLTRHMLYKEMSSLRCYHNSRLVYRLPDELCLDVERDRYISVEGSLLFLEFSYLSLAECRQLFALKVDTEEAWDRLQQLDSEAGGSGESNDVANRLSWLHNERRQRLDSLAVKSEDGLETLRVFLTQQLRWYRYAELFCALFAHLLPTDLIIMVCF